MHAGFLIIGVISSCIWTYKCTGAIPTVILTASSSPYFDIGGSISLTCAISEDVGIKNVYLSRNEREEYVWIQIKGPTSCEAFPLTSSDPHVYSVTCEQQMKVHIVVNGAVDADHNATWSCQMTSQSGICNTPCISISSVRTALRVPVSSAQLTDGNGQVLVTPVPVLDGSNTDFQCDTSLNGSRPRALFNWYRRSENQSPILIQDQSVSTPGPKPDVDLSISISYSTLTLMGNRSYQNMYIYCEARDETNRGSFTRSREAQLNIVYPPVVQLYPSTSGFNITEGSPKFVFICNVTDANPMPQLDGYGWILGGIVIQGQTRSSYELLNVQKSQDGVYQCMARNGYGTGNSSTMDLNVQYGPTISLIDYTEVEEGENVSIACIVTANPQPDIVWTRNGTVILPSSDVLRIPYISRLKDGNYTCTASNVLYPTGQSSVSRMATDTLRIHVLYGPGISNSLSPNMSVIQVEEGQKAVDIICRATCNPACSYRWLKGNVQINSSNTLSLGIVQKNMTGNYICEAFNTIRGQKRGSNISMEVIVTYTPVVKLQAAVRDVNPYRVKQGRENVVLVCEVVDAYPQPTLFVWTHSGDEIQGESRSNFTIPVATRQTNGTWGCKGLNGYGTPIESQLQVDVQYGPVLKPMTNKTVIEGQTFSVSCNVDSNPSPVFISWTKDNNATFSHNTAVLTVNSVSRYDSGTYRCRAANIIHPSGQNEESLNGMEWFYLNVQYAAKITEFVAKSNASEISENSLLQLYCRVDSNPYSVISLFLVDVLMSRIQDAHELIHNVTAGCLNVGKYICSATNSVMNGVTVFAEVNLKVQCSPRLDYRKNISTVYYRSLNDNVTLEVDVIAYPEPTDIMWYHRGDKTDIWQLVPNQPISSSGLFSTITIHLGSPADFGEYLVNMTNSFGIYDLIFQVIQKSTPQIVNIFCISRFMVNGIEFCFKPGFNGGSVQRFAIEYKSTASPDSLWKNSSITDLKETQTHTGTYYVNVSHPPPGNYEYRMYSWNDIGKSPYSLVITVFIPADTMENRNEITLIVSSTLFGLAACLFIAALVLFIRSGKGIFIGCKNNTSNTDPNISDIQLCQARDNDGVSNFQAGTGRDYQYEELSTTTSSTNEYEELSKGSEKQSMSGKHLYSNMINTTTM